jgi:ubiquinone/menaquinone biosynthesis C-methylase UbiE
MSDNTIDRFFGYLNWLFNPFHGLKTTEVYDLIGTSSLTENALYLNLGYWRDVDTIDEASEELALLVAKRGGMGPGDTVLDCGYGFGDQDILWARNMKPEKIIGLNITKSQVERARMNVADAGLDRSIDLREGSATAMPIENESIDLVVSVESAFHYRTREDFFKEAYRVLRPGGRLVTADILPTINSDNLFRRIEQGISWNLVAGKFNIPQENYYYAAENTGFKPNTERTQGTYSKYSSIDDKTDPFHYFMTLIKFGIGRTTYDSAQEVRTGHITREEAVALVRRYDTEFPD